MEAPGIRPAGLSAATGPPTRRGNPVMPLIAGIVFTSLGLLGLVSLWKGRRR